MLALANWSLSRAPFCTCTKAASRLPRVLSKRMNNAEAVHELGISTHLAVCRLPLTDHSQQHMQAVRRFLLSKQHPHFTHGTTVLLHQENLMGIRRWALLNAVGGLQHLTLMCGCQGQQRLKDHRSINRRLYDNRPPRSSNEEARRLDG